MAFSAKKHQNVTSAQNIFTDREEPRRAFWDLYNALQPGEIDSIGFYGFGGIGKTTLLRKIEEEVVAREPNSVSYYSFEFDNRKDVCLFVLSRTIMNNIKTARFPMFDFAYKTWMERMGKSEDEIKMYIASFSRKMGFLEEGMDLVGDVLPTNAAKVLLKRGLEFCSNELLKKELAKPENEAMADEIRRSDVVKLQNQMQAYFVHDAERIMEERTTPYVFLLDGYEALANRLIKGEKAKLDEYWLWNMNDGLVPFIPNTLWVVAGRERMNWSPEIMPRDHMHLMGQISKPDVVDHFKRLGITDPGLVAGFYKLTKGTPVYMDLCYKTYLKLVSGQEPGYVPDIKEFGRDTDELARRYLRDMTDYQQRTVFLMSVMPNSWSEDFLRTCARRVKYDAFVDMAFLTIIDMSVIECNGSEYKLHDTFRSVVRDFLNEDERIRLCKGVWEELVSRIKVDAWMVQARDEDAVLKYMEFLNSKILKEEVGENAGANKIITDEDLKAICMGLRSYKNEGLLKENLTSANYIYDYMYAKNRPLIYRALGTAEVIKALGNLGEYQKALDTFVAFSPMVVEGITKDTPISETIDAIKLRLAELNEIDATEQVFAYAYYLSTSSMMLIRMGQHAIANRAAEISADFMEGLFGERDFFTIEAQGTKAISLSFTPGGNEKAAVLHKKLLAVETDFFGPKSIQTMRTKNNLANNYLSIGGSGNIDKALVLHTEAYETRKEINGENHPDTLLYLQNMAQDYNAKNDKEKALELTRLAYNGRMRVLGPNHPDTLKSASILVSRLVGVEEFEEALEISEYVVKTRRDTLGATNPLTLMSQVTHADLLFKVGRTQESLELYAATYKCVMDGVGGKSDAEGKSDAAPGATVILKPGDTAFFANKYVTCVIQVFEDKQMTLDILAGFRNYLLSVGGRDKELARIERAIENVNRI